MGYYLKTGKSIEPPVGFKKNPLTHKDARNLTCPCGSMKKVKKCCGQISYVKDYLHKKLEIYIKGATGVPRKDLEEAMQTGLKIFNAERNATASVKFTNGSEITLEDVKQTKKLLENSKLKGKE